MQRVRRLGDLLSESSNQVIQKKTLAPSDEPYQALASQAILVRRTFLPGLLKMTNEFKVFSIHLVI